MGRYLIMLFLAMMLAVWIPVTLAPWVIVGPWRLIKNIGRT